MKPSRNPPIIIPPPIPSKNPATLIFLHDYNNTASAFHSSPPNKFAVAHHIHQSPALQHLKIIIPEALPSRHPTLFNNLWYDLPNPRPATIDPSTARWNTEFGHADSNAQDMRVTMDYLEALIRAEISGGTPAHRIVVMGNSQGATIVGLFIVTRRLAAELGAAISFVGFNALDLASVRRMQRENDLEGRRAGGVKLYLMAGERDEIVPLGVSEAWRDQFLEFRERGQGIAEVDYRVIDGQRHPISVRLWPHVREVLEKEVPVGGKDSVPKL